MNFEFDNKQIEIFFNKTENESLPVIILNTFSGEGNKVWEECQRLNAKDFILVEISKMSWSNDLSPWESPPLFKGDGEYKGYADKYLKQIEDNIIPKVKDIITNNLNKEIEYFGIAGYSLSGLFAVYSGYKTDIFKRIVSASGSMWYPNFLEYVKENEMSKNIDKIYFSLGNKEKNSKIEILQTVEDKTKEIQEYLGKNIISIYEENQGNHFHDEALRIAKGIKWILE